MSFDAEISTIAARVGQALDIAGVEYLLGGSVAAALHGEPRATRDVDFAVRMTEAQIPALIHSLGEDFAVDEDALREAIRSMRSTNIFYLPNVTKIDLFIRGNLPFDASEFGRRLRYEFSPGGPAIYAATPEDNLLRKLLWFRAGGEVSDQQWRDVLGIVRISGDQLDRQYLHNWAQQLGIGDLLTRLMRQA